MPMNNFGAAFGVGVGPWVFWPLIAGFVMLLVLWSILWKGLALWHSAGRREPWWFIAFLFINTIGILEIVYLFGIAKLKLRELFTKHPPHHHA